MGKIEPQRHNEHDEGTTKMEHANRVAEKILGAAFKLHKLYGAGLLESAYEHMLVYELEHNQALKVERQKIIPLVHESINIDAGYRLDLLVDNSVIVELKCIEKVLPIHESQLITYLKLSGIRLGLLINFKTTLLKDGIKRLIV